MLFGVPDDVPPSALFQKGDVVGRDHATISHPDAIRTAVTSLHRLHDFLKRRDIHAVSSEYLVAQRHSTLGNHQSNADLFAIGADGRASSRVESSGLPSAWPSKYVLVTSYNSRSYSMPNNSPKRFFKKVSNASLCGRNRVQRRDRETLLV